MATLAVGEKARMYALGGLMRGGASRGGYVDSRVYIDIDGDQIGWAPDDDARGVLLGTLSITDVLDEAVNTCSFRVNGYVPEDGAELIITRGSKNAAPLFAGYALTVQQVYAGVPRNVQADVRAVDYTWLLGMQKVTGQYRNLSATDVVKDLIAKFAAVNGFTTVNVAAGLPVLEQITFTDEDLPDAITRTCRRIGAYWYVDYRKDLHVFFTDTSRTAPQPLVPTHPSLTNFSRLHERTQGLTRVYVEGRGSSLLAAVNAGETILPVEAVDMFQALSDVFLKISFSGADGALHLNFTGVVPSAGGSLVGPGQAPSSGPTLRLQGGGAIEVGAHSYAYTWVTASGETKPSPATVITIPSGLSTPTIAPNLLQGFGTVKPPSLGGNPCWKPGDYVEWAYSYAYTAPFGFHPAANNATPLSPMTGIVAQTSPYHWVTPGDSAKSIQVQAPYSSEAACGRLFYFHRINGGPWWCWDYNNGRVNIAGGGYPPAFDAASPDSYGNTTTPIPTTTPSARSVLVEGLAIGPATVTARKLYRTKANQAALLLNGTLANNTTTEAGVDTLADAQLTTPAPTSDTSGLPQPTGQVLPGSPTVIVASTGPFAASGGWAVAGEQAIRYTGTAAGALTGVPATGPGAVVGPLNYNTAIRSAPLLTGIPATGTRSLPIPLSAGDEVYAVVQVDDAGRQAQLAADLNVADGIREEWVSDRRLSIAEARARGRATLESRPLTDATVEYTCRDQRTASGLTIHVDLPAPTAVTGDYKIQSVTWSNFRPRPEQPPTARVTASSRRFSFEDLLRKVKTKE